VTVPSCKLGTRRRLRAEPNLQLGPRTLGRSIDSAAGAARTLGGQTDRHDLPTGHQPPTNRTAAKMTVSSCKLGIGVIIVELVQPICPWYLNVTGRRTDGQTDRQTDGRTDGRTSYDSNTSLALRASRGKNYENWLLVD